MTLGGSEVVRAVPPASVGPDFIASPIRFEKSWFQGLAVIRFIITLFILFNLVFFLYFTDLNLAVYLLFAVIMLPFICYAVALILRTRPATFEMDQTGVRLYRGQTLVKEIRFGPDITVGVVSVGYWDDMSPGLTLKAAGMDENDVSLYERGGYGPLFGYRFKGGGDKIVISRKKGWALPWIQWMWIPLMDHVSRHGMKMDRSLERYLKKRREMGLPVP